TILSLDQFQCSDSSSRNDFDTQVLLCEQAQCSNISSRNDLDIYLPASFRSPDDLFNNEGVTSHSHNEQATASVMPNNDVVEELFRGQSLGVIHYFTEPVNEETVTTTPSDVEIRNTETVADTLSEPNLDDLEQHTEEANLEIINELIAKLLMTINTHPSASLRLRYKTDRRRRTANSMKIDILNLKNIQLSSDQTFWIRLLLATWTENPSDEVCLHPNKLGYHSDDAYELTDGTICVPLTSDDIKKGIKALEHLSIIKRKLKAHNRLLTPLELFGIASEIRGNKVRSARQAKKIFNNYNLKAMWIICQLLIEQNRTLQFSNVICWTRKIEEIRRPTLQLIEPIEYDEE
ncbi:unnamed protein product, partial [Adineta steineri]